MDRDDYACRQKKKQSEIEYNSPLQYINYRVPKGKVWISSEDREFRLGEMVPIIHDRKRKPLILNIFIDGLSQTVLENHMEMLMPNTYRFFREGMICTMHIQLETGHFRLLLPL